jgi:hypothetical protein
MKSIIQCWLLLMLSPIAMAQSDVGGGGDIYECVENGKTSYYLLDVLLAKKMNRPVSLKLKQESTSKKLEFKAREVELKSAIMQARLSRFDPIRASKLASEAMAIWADILALKRNEPAPNQLVWFSEDPLKFKDDSGLQYRFKNCKGDRLVTQRKPLGPQDDARYKINRNAFDLLDVDNVVAMLWHESIYRMMREDAHHQTSEQSQYLNLQLFTGRFENWTSCEYGKWVFNDAKLNSWMAWGKWEAQSSRHFRCSTEGKIINFFTSTTIQWGKDKLSVGPLVVEDDVLKSANNLNSFSMNADLTNILGISNLNRSIDENAIGTVDFSDPTVLVFRNIRSNEIRIVGSDRTVGDVSFKLYPDMTIQILSGTSSRIQSIPANLQKLTYEILSCATDYDRHYVKNHKRRELRSYAGGELRAAQLYQLFARTRRALNLESESDLNQILGECRDHHVFHDGSDTHPTDIIAHDLSRDFTLNNDAICFRYGGSVHAAFVLGASAGAWVVKCYMTKGWVRWYAGPMIGVVAGAGASFKVELPHYGNADDDIDSLGRGKYSKRELNYSANRVGFGLADASVEMNAELVTPLGTLDTMGTEVLQVGIGAITTGGFDFTVAPHLFTERKRDYNHAYQRLTASLTQQIP